MPHDLALVDDHHLMRSGLATMLNGLDGYRVTIEAANGRELIEALRDATPPAIAIVDLNMPVMDGYATIAWLRTNAPEILPLALTFDAGDDALVRAMRAGARGFVLKNVRPPVLRAALDSLVLTGYYHSEAVHESLMQGFGAMTRDERERVVRHGIVVRRVRRRLAWVGAGILRPGPRTGTNCPAWTRTRKARTKIWCVANYTTGQSLCG